MSKSPKNISHRGHYGTPAWNADRQDAIDDAKLRMRLLQSFEWGNAEVKAAESKRERALTLPETDPDRPRLLDEVATEMSAAERTQACARNYRHFIAQINENESTAQTKHGWFCGRKGCMLCTYIQARKLHREVVDKFTRAQAIIPTLSPVEITLTQQELTAPEDLADNLTTLTANLRDLFRSTDMKRAFVGGFWRIETVWSKDHRKLHVHVHAALLAADPDYFSDERYIAQPRLMQLWNQACGTSGFVSVNIRRIRHPITLESDPVSVRAGFVHVAKYCFKPEGLFMRKPDGTWFIEPELAAALTRGTKGRRLHAFMGCLSEKWLKKH